MKRKVYIVPSIEAVKVATKGLIAVSLNTELQDETPITNEQDILSRFTEFTIEI